MENKWTLVQTTESLPLTHRVRPGVGDGGAGTPCLLLLHGVGANEAGFTGYAETLDPRLTVVLARGPVTFGPQQFGWFAVNFTAAGPQINPAQAEQSRGTLVDFIGALPAAYGVDPGRIWIAGFSQGGILSASVALTRPDKVAGFAILSGRILPEITPPLAGDEALGKLCAFVSHGADDAKLSIDFGRNSERQLSARGVQLTYQEYPAGHELNASMRRDFAQWLAARVQDKS